MFKAKAWMSRNWGWGQGGRGDKPFFPFASAFFVVVDPWTTRNFLPPQIQDFILVAGPFWLGTGPLPLDDWAKAAALKGGTRRFVPTPSALLTLRALSRAVAAGKGAPILLQVRCVSRRVFDPAFVSRCASAYTLHLPQTMMQGPTSAGKTTLVEYLAARTGHRCVRINNHEHTDVAEYIGQYASDPQSGRLRFVDGLLVQALREGHW